MKKYILFFMSLNLILISCDNRKKESERLISNQNVNIFKTEGIFFNYDIEGIWVRKDYIKLLQKTKSPFEAFDGIKGISSLNINSKNDEKYHVSLLLNNEETSDGYISQDKKKGLLFNFIWNGNKSIEIKLHDGLLFFNLEGQVFEFTKIKKKVFNDDFCIDYISNITLFDNSEFSLYDTENNKNYNVVLYENGILSGLKNYNRYKIQTSFIVDVNPKDYIF